MTTSLILPLCTVDEVRAELADTERAIDRAADQKIVDAARQAERLVTLHRWRGRLREQLQVMENEAVV